jgi:trehalose 2-sulfotransferase
MLPFAPERTYFVCATPRSGSTLLCEALSRTGVAGRPAEYFETLLHSGLRRQPREYFIAHDDPTVGGLLPETAPDPGPVLPAGPYRDYLRDVVERATTPNGVLGAKVMWGYFDDFLARLRAVPGVDGDRRRSVLESAFGRPAYVHVVRRDKLRQAISLWRAIQASVWRDDGSGDARGPEPVYSAPAIAHLRDQVAEQEDEWAAYFERHGIAALELVYEDYAADLCGAVEAVLEHVGVSRPERFDVSTGMRRQADTLTEAWVARFEAEAA